MKDIPIARNFYTEDSVGYSSQPATDFYKLYTEMKAERSSAKDSGDDLMKIVKENKKNVDIKDKETFRRVYNVFKVVDKRITNINKYRKKILDSTTMSPDEKKAKVNLYDSKITLDAMKALDKYREYVYGK